MASERLVLKSSSSQALFLITVGLLFMAICLVFAGRPVTGRFAAWKPLVVFVGTPLFALAAIAGVVRLLPGGSELTLTPDAFTIRSSFRSYSYRWKDVQELVTAEMPGRTARVSLDFKPEYKGSTTLRALGRAVGGHDAALPDTYRKSPQELRVLMEDWRRRYGS
jgi:hypothetical protein